MSAGELYLLCGALAVLVIAAGFLAGSETALMALNRHRLHRLANQGHRGAARVERLLAAPDRFVAAVLLANNLALVLLVQIATLLALQIFGTGGLVLATLLLTLAIVLFGELLPKSVAATHPERYGFPASLFLRPLVWLLQPVALAVTRLSRAVLRLARIEGTRADSLNREELRTVVKEAGTMIPQRHRDMLFGILDLENVTVEDVMVPRADIAAIDLDKDWVDVFDQIVAARHTRVPCYRGSLDNVLGILHVRSLARLLRHGGEVRTADIEALLTPPYFVPLRADLHTQLVNFQRARQRLALVVDEYGDIQGLVTVDDLLEQVIGELTPLPPPGSRDAYPQPDGSYLVDGAANVRELNRAFDWELPEDGPKTLNGLIIQTLEDIPEPGTSLKVGDYTIEIVHTTSQAVRNARVFPPEHRAPA